MTIKLNQIEGIKEYYNVIENNDLVIIYWYTRWCPDCFLMKAALPKLEKDFKDYSFYSVNRDTDIEIAKHLNIFGIPSFLIYNKGEEVARYVDKKRKTYIQVKEFIVNAIK